MTNVIETKNLCRYFGSEATQVKALDDVSFTIEKGEFTAIIGPSGSGKTTLLHLIGGLDNPSSGIIELSGVNIANMSGNQLSDFRRDHIGFIFQSYNLIPVLSAEENIEYIMLLQQVASNERKARVKEMLHLVGLEGMGDWKDGVVATKIAFLVGGIRPHRDLLRSLSGTQSGDVGSS